MTTDRNGNVVTVNGLLSGDQPLVFRLNVFMSATIPAGASITADLAIPGQVTYSFNDPIVVSMPLLPNPTIESVTVQTDGTYVSYSGNNGYGGMVNFGLQRAVNGDYRVGALTTFLVNNINNVTSLFGTPVPPPRGGNL